MGCRGSVNLLICLTFYFVTYRISIYSLALNHIYPFRILLNCEGEDITDNCTGSNNKGRKINNLVIKLVHMYVHFCTSISPLVTKTFSRLATTFLKPCACPYPSITISECSMATYILSSFSRK